MIWSKAIAFLIMAVIAALLAMLGGCAGPAPVPTSGQEAAPVTTVEAGGDAEVTTTTDQSPGGIEAEQVAGDAVTHQYELSPGLRSVLAGLTERVGECVDSFLTGAQDAGRRYIGLVAGCAMGVLLLAFFLDAPGGATLKLVGMIAGLSSIAIGFMMLLV